MPTARPVAACLLRALAAALAAACAGGVQAAQPAGPAGAIYTCTTPDGRRVTSDRLIPECSSREQRLLNSDGSLRQIIPPQLTADERAEKEARDRKAELERLAQLDAARRDRHLMLRYPDEPTHEKAREAALDTVRLAMRASEKRIAELAAERKPLLQEAEFYKGKSLPTKLKQELEGNEAATEAQRTAIQNQQAELERVNRLYDSELARLKRLWAGAPPGSTLAEGSANGTAHKRP